MLRFPIVKLVRRGFCAPILASCGGEQRWFAINDPLAPRQKEVLALAAEGLTNLGIGKALGLTEKSVENNMSSIYSELGIREDADRNSRVTAVRMWLESHPDE